MGGTLCKSLQKTIFSFILFMMTISCFAGWIESDKDGTTIIHLKVDGLPDPTNSDIYMRAESAGVQAFVKEFPKIFAKKYAERYKADPKKYGKYNWDKVEVRLSPFSGITVEGVENDLLAIAGKMAPDVLYINFRKSDNYIRNGFLYPLDEYIAALTPQEKTAIDTERVHPRIWDVIRRKGADGKVHIWSLPFGGSPLGKVLMYRKDLFDRHGIPYPDSKWTWDDMFNACKKITDPSKGIYGTIMSRGKGESFNWITFLWSAGGEAMEYDQGKDQWKCTFDSPAAVTAVDFYTRLCSERWSDDKGVVRRGYAYKDADGRTKWSRGEVGLFISYIGDSTLSTFNSEINGIAPVPLGPTGIRGAELNSRMYGIFSEIKDIPVRDAAWEYIHFLDSDTSMRIRTDMLVDGGMGQFIMPKYLLKYGYEDIIHLSPKGWNDIFEIALNTGKPEPYGKNSNFAYHQMSIPLQLVEGMELRGELPGINEPEKRRQAIQSVLTESVTRTNELMIGVIPAPEKMKRRVLAIVFLSAIVITYFFVFKKVFKIFSEPSNSMKKPEKWGFRKYRWAYLLLLPALLTIFIWNYLPLARGSVMALYDYKILGKSIFVGVDNFGDLLVDSFWWQSIWNALRYSMLIIVLTFLPPLILAVLLQEIPKGKLLFRMIYYLPAVISGLVTMLLWKQFYEPSEFGVLNKVVLQIPAWGFLLIGIVLLVVCLVFARRLWFYRMWVPMFLFAAGGVIIFFAVAAFAKPILFLQGEPLLAGLANIFPRLLCSTGEPYRWLSNPNTAMISCVIPMVWAGIGPGCLIYLAALKGIPDDYYEAADIDGATFIDKILFIVFPTVKTLLVINFVGVFIGSWYSSTGNILVMTGGDAATNTETAGLYIWYKAFSYLNFGPATAAAWMLAFMLIGFTVYQLQILSKVEFRTAAKK